MQRLSFLVLGTAALVFVAISATMNALFLSSLGRTSAETALLAAVSLAADLTKLILPVIALRALASQCWGQAIAATLMLAVVTGLSLASGTGFAAMTRDGVSARRDIEARTTQALRQDLAAVEVRLQGLAGEREREVIEAELASKSLDRQWSTSNGCATPAAARYFCAEVGRLKVALASAMARAALLKERHKLLAELGNSKSRSEDSDPQVSVLAETLGIEFRHARALLTGYVAVLLEIGSVVLVALASGLAGRQAVSAPKTPAARIATEPVEVPAQVDRDHWLKERTRRVKSGFETTRGRIEGGRT